VFALSTARVFFEMDRGSLGYHANFTTDLDGDGIAGDGRLYYIGDCPAVFKITVTASHASKSTGVYYGELRVNGQYASLPASLQRFSKSQRLLGYAYSEDVVHLETLAALNPNDYVSFWVSSSTGDPIEFRDVVIVAHQVSDFQGCGDDDADDSDGGDAKEEENKVMTIESDLNLVDMEIYVDVTATVY